MSLKILVATDGSPAAVRATAVAADIAKVRDGELVILSVREDKPLPESVRRMAETEHLVDPVPAPPARNIANVPTWMADGVRAAAVAEENLDIRQALARAAVVNARESLRQAGIERLRTLIEDGVAAEQILAVAEREKADMIVMGSRGLGAVKSLFQGSVTRDVAGSASCTCITVS